MKTLIAIDIGNTSIHMARYAGRRWEGARRVPTSQFRSVPARIAPLLKGRDAVVVIASVVPQAGRYLEKAIARRHGAETRLIGPRFPVPVANRYKDPRQVGVDRLLNALAAFYKYRKPCIVIDFGTAITFDVVGRKGEYLGGVIAPGIEITIEALFQKTALLPKIRLSHPKSAVGKDTAESIRVGCSVGIGGLCDRLVETIEKRQGFRALVLSTGGYAPFMARYCRRPGRIEPDLTLDGIYLTYKRHLLRRLLTK